MLYWFSVCSKVVQFNCENLGCLEKEENRKREDKMVGWHHRLNGHEFEEAPGVGDGQGNLVCCNPWGYRDSDTTE